jgi:hypothetical protein
LGFLYNGGGTFMRSRLTSSDSELCPPGDSNGGVVAPDAGGTGGVCGPGQVIAIVEEFTPAKATHNASLVGSAAANTWRSTA